MSLAIHMRSEMKWGGAMACGIRRRYFPTSRTFNPTAVTCGNCIRTKYFIDRVAHIMERTLDRERTGTNAQAHIG